MGILRSFFKTAALILVVNFVIKITWVLGIEVLMQNALGVEEYGGYYTFLNLSFTLSFFLDFGLSRYNGTYTAIHQKVIKSDFSQIVRIKLLLSLVYLGTTSLISILLGYSTQEVIFIDVLALIQVLGSFTLFYRSIFSGLRIFFWEGFASVSDRFLMIVFCVIILYGPLRHLLSIRTFLTVQIVATAITFLFLSGIIFRINKESTIKNTEREKSVIEILKLCFPFALVLGLEVINDKMGIVILERLHENGKREAGLYAYGLRWLDAFKMFAALIAVVLTPYFASILNDTAKISKLFKYTFCAIIMPMILVSSLLIFFSDVILMKLYGDASQKIKYIFETNVVTFLPHCLFYVLQPYLMIRLQLKKMITAFVLCFLINLILYIINVPQFGAVGVSLIYLATFSLMTILLFFRSDLIDYNIAWRWLSVKWFFYIYGLVAISFFLNLNFVSIFWGLSIIFLWLMIMPFAIRLIKVGHVRQMIDTVRTFKDV